MSAALADLIERRLADISARVAAALMAAPGSVFAHMSAAQTGAALARLLRSLADDARADGAGRPHAAARSLIAELGPRGLTFHDIRALATAFRREVLDAVGAAVPAAELRRAENWLF